jgi:hypothetical protein
MEEYIQSCSAKVEKTFLYTALISVKEKPSIMRELNLMGINEMALFPSIDGICRAMKSLYFSADTVGPSIKEMMEFINKTKPETASPPEEI